MTITQIAGMVSAMLAVLALVVLKMIYENRQRTNKRLFCVDCETVSPFQEPRRSAWTWLLLGPFCFLWSKKLTCPSCNGHNLIPSSSPRAMSASKERPTISRHVRQVSAAEYAAGFLHPDDNPKLMKQIAQLGRQQ
jgi:hypothetical protein